MRLRFSKKIRRIINRIIISLFFFFQVSFLPVKSRRNTLIFSKSSTIVQQNLNIITFRGGIQRDRAQTLLEELDNIKKDLVKIQNNENTLWYKISGGAEKDILGAENHLIDSKIKLLQNQLSSRPIFKIFIRELNEIDKNYKIQVKRANERLELLKIGSIKDKAIKLKQQKEEIMGKLDTISNEILAPDPNYFFGNL